MLRERRQLPLQRLHVVFHALAVGIEPVNDGRHVQAVELLGEGAAFGDGSRCYVGDLPGLAALDGLGADAGPAAVLGTDVLRRRPRMVYRASEVLL